jgi:hypothetical protein
MVLHCVMEAWCVVDASLFLVYILVTFCHAFQECFPMNAFMREFTQAARESPRLFFAPIVGAVSAVRVEMRRLAGTRSYDVQNRHHRNTTNR